MFLHRNFRAIVAAGQSCGLKNVTPAASTMNRSFYAWLNSVFNRVDDSRIKQVGPDRACAEWLLRCGASVKWVNSENFLSDYNLLPVGSGPQFKIAEVDATDSAIMEIGFRHFKGLSQFRKITFKNCLYISDKSMRSLAYLCQDQLQWVEVINCADISDEGLVALKDLHKLKVLHFEDLKAVRNAETTVELLKTALPDCQITFPPYFPPAESRE